MVGSISAADFHELTKIRKQLLVVDVRTPAEYEEVHITCAQNRPLDRLQPEELVKSQADQTDPIYVLCKSGTRGKMACERISAAGGNAINIEGGTEACVRAGVPVVRGKKAISLERQVRIAAGALVLIGAVLGMTVHPYWAGLSAFVGAGLMFAGITDTCGMAMMLARMPWNRRGGANCSRA